MALKSDANVPLSIVKKPPNVALHGDLRPDDDSSTTIQVRKDE